MMLFIKRHFPSMHLFLQIVASYSFFQPWVGKRETVRTFVVGVGLTRFIPRGSITNSSAIWTPMVETGRYPCFMYSLNLIWCVAARSRFFHIKGYHIKVFSTTSLCIWTEYPGLGRFWVMTSVNYLYVAVLSLCSTLLVLCPLSHIAFIIPTTNKIL